MCMKRVKLFLLLIDFVNFSMVPIDFNENVLSNDINKDCFIVSEKELNVSYIIIYNT